MIAGERAVVRRIPFGRDFWWANKLSLPGATDCAIRQILVERIDRRRHGGAIAVGIIEPQGRRACDWPQFAWPAQMLGELLARQIMAILGHDSTGGSNARLTERANEPHQI
jgi:hypothetical protein